MILFRKDSSFRHQTILNNPKIKTQPKSSRKTEMKFCTNFASIVLNNLSLVPNPSSFLTLRRWRISVAYLFVCPLMMMCIGELSLKLGYTYVAIVEMHFENLKEEDRITIIKTAISSFMLISTMLI